VPDHGCSLLVLLAVTAGAMGLTGVMLMGLDYIFGGRDSHAAYAMRRCLGFIRRTGD